MRDKDENNDEVFLVCAECYGNTEYFEEIGVVSAGDEFWNICPSCNQVEGKTIHVDEVGKKVNL